MFDASTSRLQRARHQYENLLLHAGEIVKEEPSPNKSMGPMSVNSFSQTRRRPDLSSPPKLGLQHGTRIDRRFSTESDIIISLQEEIDRLREKLDNVLGTAEMTYEQAKISQVSLYLAFSVSHNNS